MPVFVSEAIISDVEVYDIHRWDVSVAEAVEIQRGLAGRVVWSGRLDAVELIAGVDISGGGIWAGCSQVRDGVARLDIESCPVVDNVFQASVV